MVSSFSGNTGVNNTYSRIILFINWSKRVLVKPKSPKHTFQELSSIRISYSINKIYFHGTQCIYQLSFGPVHNCNPGKCKRKSSGGSPLGRIIYICSIHKTYQFSLINVLLGFGYIFVPYNRMKFGVWKIQLGYYSFVSNPPVSSNTEISSKVIHATVVIIRSGRSFGYYGDTISNIWSTGNISIH